MVARLFLRVPFWGWSKGNPKPKSHSCLGGRSPKQDTPICKLPKTQLTHGFFVAFEALKQTACPGRGNLSKQRHANGSSRTSKARSARTKSQIELMKQAATSLLLSGWISSHFGRWASAMTQNIFWARMWHVSCLLASCWLCGVLRKCTRSVVEYLVHLSKKLKLFGPSACRDHRKRQSNFAIVTLELLDSANVTKASIN